MLNSGGILKFAWVIPSLLMSLILGLSSYHPSLTLDSSDYLNSTQEYLLMWLGLFLMSAGLASITARLSKSSNNWSQKSVVSLLILLSPVILNLMFGFQLELGLLFAILVIFLSMLKVDSLLSWLTVISLTTIAVISSFAVRPELWTWQPLSLGFLGELMYGIDILPLLISSGTLIVIFGLTGLITIQKQLRLRVALIIVMVSLILAVGVFLGLPLVIWQIEYLLIWVAVMLLVSQGFSFVSRRMEKVVISSETRGFIVMATVGLLLFVSSLPLLRGQLVFSGNYINPELSQVYEYYPEQKILVVSWDSNPKDNNFHFDYISSEWVLSQLLDSHRPDLIILDYSTVEEYRLAIKDNLRVSQMIESMENLTFDVDSNQWETLEVYKVTESPHLLANSIQVQGNRIIAEHNLDSDFDFSKLSLGKVSLKAIYSENYLTLIPQFISTPGLSLSSVQIRLAGNKSVALVAGSKFLGELNQSKLSSLEVNLTAEDLRNLQIYQLSDQNSLRTLTKWTHPTNCEGGNSSSKFMRDLSFSFNSSKDFCIEFVGPNLEFNSSGLIVADIKFSSNSKVSACTKLSHQDCELVYLNQSDSNIEYAKVVDGSDQLVTSIQVSAANANRNISISNLAGTIREYKLIALESIQVSFSNQNSQQVSFSIKDSILGLKEADACSGTLDNIKSSDDRNVLIYTTIFTCLEADLGSLEQGSWILLKDIPPHLTSCLFMKGSNECIPLLDLDSQYSLVLVSSGEYRLRLSGLGLNSENLWLRGFRVFEVDFGMFGPDLVF